MEPREPKKDDQHPRSGSPPEGEIPAGNGGPAAGPQTIKTSDPVITSEPEYSAESKGQPDRTTIIETSRIRGPDEAFQPNFVLVPVEPAPPPRDRPGAGGGEARESSSPPRTDRNGGRDGAGGRQGEHDHPAKPQTPSLTKVLLYSGLVSLVCGVAGAWAYSHFLGSSKSEDQKSSGKDSGSKKGSDVHESSGSEKGSDSDQTSDTSQKEPGKGDLHQAEEAWLSAIKELHQAQAEERAARRSEEETRVVLDFLKKTLLSAGRAGDGALAETFWSEGQGKDMTLRKALDETEPQVAGVFADRPMAEASVREMLGLGYLNVGQAARAVQEYERALALREAYQGSNLPDTAACRNQLAVAYRLAGRSAEAGRLFERNPNSPAHASALAIRGLMLLREKKPAEAELKLRECLTIREKTQPQDWTTFDTKSSLGEALLEQNKFADAEPLLLSGYQGLKQHEGRIPPQDRPRLTKALERLVRLYDAWGKKDEAVKWQKELAAAGEQTPGPP